MARRLTRFGSFAVLVLLLILGWASTRVAAAPRVQETTPTPESIPIKGDRQCKECHSAPDQIMTLPSGESLYLTIDVEGYAASAHGSQGYTCIQCHTTITEYPHVSLTAQNLRQVAAEQSQSCKACHAPQFEKQLDSAHQKFRDEGNENAAVCSDCHNPHYTQPPNEPRSKIITTCARCHSRIAAEYRASVHGEALVSAENTDVPACVDCHGVHNIPDPRTAEFLLRSPQICAECHSDAERMAKYDVNTEVIDTYVADFHGTTVTLFEQQSPDQLPNKPLCIDCHGVHNIKVVTDAESTVIKQNLLATCQQCHPDATANFPEAWLSHYTPSPTRNALVYFVDLFYQILIPATLVGITVFVASDVGRRIVGWIKGGRK